MFSESKITEILQQENIWLKIRRSDIITSLISDAEIMVILILFHSGGVSIL